MRNPPDGPHARSARVVHEYFLGLLAVSYALALYAPGPGVWLRQIKAPLAGDEGVALSQVGLALLLVIAGIGVSPRRLRESLLRPMTLGGALLLKLVVPLAVVAAVATGNHVLGDPVPVEMLLGLAIVAAMPAAASCPAWTQASGGEIALALGVVVGSTFLGPWAGQLWLPQFTEAAGGDTQVARGIGRAVLGSYFLLWVLAPSALGVGIRVWLGEDRLARLRPALRLVGSGLLLVLIYAFASASLSLVEARRAGEQLAAALLLAGILCGAAFLAGWLLAKATRAPRTTTIALVYSVGMHNNGVALLLADTVLPRASVVFLPIISYALVQHAMAGVVDAWFARTEPDRPPATDAPAQ